MARNLMQTRNGGHDIVGLEWLALEVKHHETLNITQWWLQTKKQATNGKTPVLMYKQNNVKWRVMMFGYLGAGSERVRCPVDISLEAFMAFFKARVKHEVVPVVIRSPHPEHGGWSLTLPPSSSLNKTSPAPAPANGKPPV
jgi:hypothetical protein